MSSLLSNSSIAGKPGLPGSPGSERWRRSPRELSRRRVGDLLFPVEDKVLRAVPGAADGAVRIKAARRRGTSGCSWVVGVIPGLWEEMERRATDFRAERFPGRATTAKVSCRAGLHQQAWIIAPT
jgi:hypothetical protein